MKRREFVKSALLAPAAGTMLASLVNAQNDAKPSRKNPVIDFEAHYLDPVLFEAMKTRTVPPTFDPKTQNLALYTDMPGDALPMDPSNLLDIGEGRIKAMDQAGVDIQLLSTTLPLEVSYAGNEADELMPEVNRRLAGYVAEFPKRFRGMANVSANDPKKAADELKRCVEELGFVGWHLHSRFRGENEYADHEKYLPIWEMISKLDIPVYIHPASPIMPALQGYGYVLYGSPFGFAIESSILLMRLILSGLFDRFPNVKIIQGHMGETFPFLIERMDEQIATKSRKIYKLKKLPGEYWRENVWCSTSGCFSKDVFQMLRSQMPLDHILFGSDYPYEDYAACTKFVNELPLTDEERAGIYSVNAVKAFGIK